ncbi:hypothetical protein L218DRAFT_1075713 [Marasmius fiardii PR-910]|nr:hypothetical protein L218DRAFT_1075713 [Marasmius fiardii PR-910]
MSTSAAPSQHQKQHKKKKSRATRKSQLIDLPPECRLSKLPVELLAEILLYTKSPRDVLSVARSCKVLCYTLLHHSNQFIWRYCRMNCKPEPLPEPVARFTEAAYAAFVFDTSNCEVCAQPAPLMAGSYGLRLKICRKPECKKALSSAPNPILTPSMDFFLAFNIWESHRDRPYFSALPSAETSTCLNDSIPNDMNTVVSWPELKLTMRISDLTEAYQEYLDESSTPEKFEAYVQRCQKRAAQNREFMTLCVSLYRWKCKFEKAVKTTKKENEKAGKAIANRHGHDHRDLIATTSFGEVYRAKNQALERITDFDYRVRKEAISAHLLKIKAQRDRREHEDNYRKARDNVVKHYNRLRTAKQETPLPTLERFRELPIIAQLQKNARSEVNLDTELKSSVITSLLNTQLEEWRTKTMDHLGTLIGQPAGWRSASTKILHPVQRVTARFKCGRCKRLEMKYVEHECLDLAGVCTHQCRSEKNGNILNWNVEKFITDEKAIKAMTKVVELCNIDAENSSSISALKGIGCEILCLSCESLIVMSPDNVIGHCHRHEDMEMSRITKEEMEALLKGRPMAKLAQRLLGNEKKYQAARKLVAYGCRHCDQRKSEATASGKRVKGGSSATATNDNATTSSDIAVNANSNTPYAGGNSTLDAAADTNASITGTNASESGVAGTSGLAKTAEGEGNKIVTPPTEPQKRPHMFSFDGLRSHMKTKHSILNVRDEDFYCTSAEEILISSH